ncbi:nuclear transport factor 2 family protein [Fulvivirga sedimenti]|uniref:Nuclear transport factor 2 family protein n=1 Tax=Fulvivirga sedimenti TaxID=2879465 RepID=A0A9X1HLU8_9BACT|nr:nuclear transport factor 2 family protein [Fulvivirga sedimenti]MCA6073706.1 nuclear transport factor 2 family protein [Fulvivirga sedimenti]
MKKFFIIIIMLYTPFCSTFAQSEEIKVSAIILSIFDGMREGDSSKVASHFVRDATMLSVFYDKDGKSTLREGSLQQWLNAIGTPREEMLDERIWDTEVKIDDNLATVWTSYALYVGENYSHCGVDAFQLYHDGNAWKVFHVSDTRRKECDIPDYVKGEN